MSEIQQEHHIDVNDYGPELKSLSFKTREGFDATTGVLSPGKSRPVSTNRQEIIILSKFGGDLKVTLPGETEGKIYRRGETVMLPANTSGIQLEALESQVSYECIYIPNEDQKTSIDTYETATAANRAIEN